MALFQLVMNMQNDSCQFKTNDTFDIYYVNLESEIGRKNHLEMLLNTAKCKFTRFNAVHGKSLENKTKTLEDYTKPLDLDNIQFPDFSGIWPGSMGMVGCKLSHYLLLRKIEKSGNDRPVLILEDDVDLECDFVVKIEKALESMPVEWDILLVSPYFNSFDPSLVNHTPSFEKPAYSHYFEKNITRVSGFFETSGFIVNGAKAAKKIADIIYKDDDKYCPIDLFWSMQIKNQKMIIYALKNKLAIQLTDVFHSSIPTSSKMNQLSLQSSLSEEIVRLNFINLNTMKSPVLKSSSKKSKQKLGKKANPT